MILLSNVEPEEKSRSRKLRDFNNYILYINFS